MDLWVCRDSKLIRKRPELLGDHRTEALKMSVRLKFFVKGFVKHALACWVFTVTVPEGSPFCPVDST